LTSGITVNTCLLVKAVQKKKSPSFICRENATFSSLQKHWFGDSAHLHSPGVLDLTLNHQRSTFCLSFFKSKIK
jgi:hypothetical protein